MPATSQDPIVGQRFGPERLDHVLRGAACLRRNLEAAQRKNGGRKHRTVHRRCSKLSSLGTARRRFAAQRAGKTAHSSAKPWNAARSETLQARAQSARVPREPMS